MQRWFVILIAMVLLAKPVLADSPSRELKDIPRLPEDTQLTDAEKVFGRRGKIGGFSIPPSRYGVYEEDEVYYGDIADGSIKMSYEKAEGREFCGTYIIILGDISEYKTLSFMVKGEKGGECFEIGMNDAISNRREDAVIVGSIFRYLPEGVNAEWQEAKIPLEDFYGADLSRVFSLVFSFNEPGKGSFWVDHLRFHDQLLVDREREIKEKGFLLLDNFDHSNVNLLGRKADAYKRLPSVCIVTRESEGRFGERGRSLKLTYDKADRGWCGYYSLLNQVDGEYYDLSGYDALSFMVRGEQGGETFEIGMADRNWLIIGDSLKAGTIENYFPQGVTKEWQEVNISLKDFGALDFSEMGSLTINFHQAGQGALYIDELKFYLKDDSLLKPEDEPAPHP